MTARERETVLRALDCWREAITQMADEDRALEVLAGRITRAEEIEALQRRIQSGELQ